MSRSGVASLLCASLLTLASPALAQVSSAADAGAADEIAAIQKQLARDFEALSSGDCAVACQALASMQRSTDRLCALDPGPPCSEARAKLADAENRVRNACPDCAVAVDRKPPEAAPGATPTAANAPAPPAEAPGGGGCAGCTVGGDGPGAAGALAAAAAIAAWIRRRRR
jgi:MYXO-CTERM domain-containing protein